MILKVFEDGHLVLIDEESNSIEECIKNIREYNAEDDDFDSKLADFIIKCLETQAYEREDDLVIISFKAEDIKEL